MLRTGIDTETQRGVVVLVSTPTRALEFPRSFDEAATWIAGAADEPEFVAWNVSYDAQALLRLAKLTRAVRESFHRLGLTTRAVVDGWSVKFIPRKVLSATKGSGRNRRRFAIHDGFPFYQMGLDKAAKKILGETGKTALPPALERMLKTGRMGTALRDPKWRALVLDYCARDAALAEKLWARLAASCEAAALDCSRAVSPASLARKRWGGEMAGKFEQEDEDFAEPSYRGGRIEVLARGTIPTCKRWDLHSAYPSVMTGFRSPKSCGRIEGGKLRRDAAYAVVDATVSFAPGFAAYPVPLELPGIGLVYPWGSWRARMDLHTWRAVLAAPRGMVEKLVVHRLVQWVPVFDERPFAAMVDLYKRRETDPSASLALKLVLNASYGLLAERVPYWQEVNGENDIGEAVKLGGSWYRRGERLGRGTSFVLAAHVTGAVRARVWRETLDAEPFAFMTDGVLCRGTPSGRIGKALGEWGDEGQGAALVVGSGLYATESDEKTSGARRGRDGRWWKTMTRGWKRLPVLSDMLADAGRADTLRLHEIRAASIRQLAVRPRAKWQTMNVLRNLPRFLDLNFDRKRRWAKRLRAADFTRKLLTSEPLGFIE